VKDQPLVYCRTCGVRADPRAEFCPNCGAKLSDRQATVHADQRESGRGARAGRTLLAVGVGVAAVGGLLLWRRSRRA
jgi:predicted RNA-binding Zn-ribbon protein involved in translation (DUF1610 family)